MIHSLVHTQLNHQRVRIVVRQNRLFIQQKISIEEHRCLSVEICRVYSNVKCLSNNLSLSLKYNKPNFLNCFHCCP
jgi:hypothetical protein